MGDEVKPAGVPPGWSDVIKKPEGTRGRTSKTVQAMKDFLEKQTLNAEQVVTVRRDIEKIKASVVRHASQGNFLFRIFFGALWGRLAGGEFDKVFLTLEERKGEADKALEVKYQDVNKDNWSGFYQEAIEQDKGEDFAILRRKAGELGLVPGFEKTLAMAAEKGLPAIVKKILEEKKSDAPLFVHEMCLAAKAGHVEIVRAFLDAGVPVDSVDKSQGMDGTALHLAARSGAAEVVNALLA